MILNVGCTLGYEVLTPTAHFTFNVLVNTDAQQNLVAEELVFRPETASEKISSSKGNRVVRVEAAAGRFELQYSATVETRRMQLPAELKPDNPGRLPLTVLTYMLPSRYCESDRFAQAAWELFGSIENRAEQVREVCRWVDANLEYKKGATDGRTSAWDVWQNRQGVCRDYTHLSIALCRALSIPARYVGGFAVGLDPMDFHACFEAYLGGAWYLFDPTDGISPDEIAVIARGRDAANASLTTVFGKVKNAPTIVSAVRAGLASAPETPVTS
ncbi:MAG TPA: transglutaminase family protein [Opitutaceae bacterium]|nr:transglutaminase family protein [Opitutaceae bacterium]